MRMQQTSAGQAPAFRFCGLDKSAQVRHSLSMTKQERDDLDARTFACVQAAKSGVGLVSIAKACGLQGLVAINAGHPETRKIDRALQRLRKAGRIQFDRSEGWTIV